MLRYKTVFVIFLFAALTLCTLSAAASDEWTCPNCGSLATGNYCNYCGHQNPSAKTAAGYLETIFSSSTGRIGNTTVQLKKGFDFINTGSSHYNLDLALTAVTLSAQIYTNASGDHTEIILKKLGYESTFPLHFDISYLKNPVANFGYKRLEDGKNLFTVVVRGTDSDLDIYTDVIDGTFSMFSESGDNVRDGLLEFMEKATGKSREDIKGEENYFFFTGHSLGGAIANYLSVENTIMQYAHSDKEKIYTYTFESPHTCVNLWWTDPELESNAFNYKVESDAVTDLPNYPGSTTYGKDIHIKVSELSNTTFRSLFTESEKDTIDDAVSVEGHGDIFGLHDTCLGLIYIMDEMNKDIIIDSTNFPDAYFRDFVSSQFDFDKDGCLSRGEINAVTVLTLPDTPIESVKGIEYFSELQYMEISGCLKTLDCSRNPSLEELYCGDCELTSLNVKDCKNLKGLFCGASRLKEIDVSGCDKLETLDCYSNEITRIDISGCNALRDLTCFYNNISVLDISSCPLLIDVYQNGEVVETPGEVLDWGEEIGPYISYQSGKAASPDELYEYYQELCVDTNVSIVF